MTTSDQHFRWSSYRETVVEHQLLADLLSRAWSRGVLIEVSRAETDQYGYDLVLTAGTITRHVQVKASIKGGRTAKQTVHVSLLSKPSPCVVWVVVRDDADRLATDHYLFFGGRPGRRMPDLGDTRGKNPWTGSSRDRTRLIEKSKFRRVDSADALLLALFGSNADGNGQPSV